MIRTIKSMQILLTKQLLFIFYLLFVVNSLQGREIMNGGERTATSLDAPGWETDYRIPQHTQPLHYDVYLFPDLEADTFSGKVAIDIQITGPPRSYLVVHIKHLNITKTRLIDTESGEEVELAESFEYKPNEFWVVRPQANFITSDLNYTLFLEFDGKLVGNGILGFYKSVYVDSKTGENRAIATSKFQPTYARRAFPCFDEPSFKSTFSVTLIRPSSSRYIALSNMPEVRSKEDTPLPGYTEVTFLKSVPMVTYLAIFVVCDLTFTETVTAIHKIPMRVYGTSGQVKRLDYAAKIGAAIADYYESYFGIKYPLPKLDMAAIPDYSSGATEHWGLITYRETNLIYDPSESSFSNKVRVATVIAHELAHQWFGNLMTVFWWNDLWLNEGFASYIEYKGIKAYEADWDTESLFLTSDLHRVLNLDSTLSSHAIVVDVNTPDQINAVFDTISYSKGASVIRMLESFMGSEEFRNGIHNFLVRFAYKNAVTQDLFDELSQVSSGKLNVTKIMNTWTRQKGYPILTMSKVKNTAAASSSSSCPGYSSCYRVTQQRFLSDPEAYNLSDEPSPYAYKWEIPVTYTSSMNSDIQQAWLHQEQTFLDIPIPNDAKWMKFNVNQTGYYRVNYPEEDWSAFGELLLNWAKESRGMPSKSCPLSTPDRVSLINDAFSLAAAHRLPYRVALNLTKYLIGEFELGPWETALGELQSLAGVLYYSNVYPLLNSFISSLIRPLYKELGWDDDGGSDGASFTTTLLRPLILDMACNVGNKNCMSVAGQKFLAWKEHNTKISPDLRSVVYSYGMQSAGDQETWEWLFERYRNETNAQEKAKLLRGLTSIEIPWLLSRLTELAREISNVREQDYFTLLAMISSNRVGEPIVWDFYRNEWNYLVERFTLNDRLFGRLITVITGRFSTQLRLDEMKDFFEKYPEAGAGDQYRKIALETVENNIKFRESHAKEIYHWLQDNAL